MGGGALIKPLAPRSFFALDSQWASAFAEYEYVWEILPAIQRLVHEMVPARTVVKGRVSSGAHIADRHVYVDESAIIETGVYIGGPCFLGPNTHVRHGAYIRGGVIMLEGSILGHASEAKNAIFFPGSKAPHFAYVGDSILGCRVNLGAGTKLSNLGIANTRNADTGARQMIKIRHNDNVYDTGLSKFGGILGDDCQTGCNTVLNPGVLMGPECLVYPNTAVERGYYEPRSILKLRQHIEVAQRY